MEPEDGDLGQGRGKAKAAAMETPRVPRARGRLDRPIIGALSTTTPDRNATGSDPEGLRVALVQIFRLGLCWG